MLLKYLLSSSNLIVQENNAFPGAKAKTVDVWFNEHKTDHKNQNERK